MTLLCQPTKVTRVRKHRLQHDRPSGHRHRNHCLASIPKLPSHHSREHVRRWSCRVRAEISPDYQVTSFGKEEHVQSRRSPFMAVTRGNKKR